MATQSKSYEWYSTMQLSSSKLDVTKTGNGERGTGSANGEQGTGKGEQGAGNG